MLMNMQNTFSLAMCYVPWQRWGEYYDPCQAFRRGTMFPILDKPFLGGARK